jgi:hypothetical protein
VTPTAALLNNIQVYNKQHVRPFLIDRHCEWKAITRFNPPLFPNRIAFPFTSATENGPANSWQSQTETTSFRSSLSCKEDGTKESVCQKEGGITWAALDGQMEEKRVELNWLSRLER